MKLLHGQTEHSPEITNRSNVVWGPRSNMDLSWPALFTLFFCCCSCYFNSQANTDMAAVQGADAALNADTMMLFHDQTRTWSCSVCSGTKSMQKAQALLHVGGKGHIDQKEAHATLGGDAFFVFSADTKDWSCSVCHPERSWCSAHAVMHMNSKRHTGQKEAFAALERDGTMVLVANDTRWECPFCLDTKPMLAGHAIQHIQGMPHMAALAAE